MNDEVAVLKRGHLAKVYVSEVEDSGVHIAANNFVRDLESVCGCKAAVSTEMVGCAMVIGTLGIDPYFDAKMKALNVPLDPLRKSDGTLHFEGFLQQMVDGVLYIVGADRRGTIFGMYDLCEQMGVSPWYYWADVPIQTKEVFALPFDFCKVDWPSVPYRGIFINDEEELEEWAKKHTPDGTIGPTTYEKIFELLLRLKANYIWPAMHVNYFHENPENGALAERMGIVIGTSHCDMLLRSNQNEWQPWLREKGYTDAVYDYSINGKNREVLKEYWRESVQKNKNYEVSFTMGMRGIHDSGFHTKAIDEDPSLTKEEKKKARVNLLAKVMEDQRLILEEVLGKQKTEASLKTFVPYKEVLELYNEGLEVPKDVTLVWANDNFGHIRRYPTQEEASRIGGHGLYFHSSYWAAPGTGMSYLFINSIPLSQMATELKKAYASGIRKMWVLNIGGLKPVEQDMTFFLHYGWVVGKEEALTQDSFVFTKQWVDTTFSGNHGEEVAKLYETFAQVTNVRKIEHMENHVFSQTAYGDEAGRRLLILEDLFRRGNAVLQALPTSQRPAFFQLILMKIHASYYTNHAFYYADRSQLCYERGNMQAADVYTAFSRQMMDFRRRMLHFYNKKMSGGKWDEILTPESFSPPPTAQYPASRPALTIGESALRVDLWNEEESLSFSAYGTQQKWIELGNQGAGEIPFHIEVKEGASWLSLSETEGVLQTEKRLLVSVKDLSPYEAGASGLLLLYEGDKKAGIPIKVEAQKTFSLPKNFDGFVQTEGYVSIPAEGYHTQSRVQASSGKDSKQGWVKVNGLGRYEGAAMMAWGDCNEDKSDSVQENPCLIYPFYVQEEGAYELEIYRVLTLSGRQPVRFAVLLDDQEPMIISSDTYDEWKGSWQQSIFENGERLTVVLPNVSAGVHQLKVFQIDPFVTFSKFVLYGRERKETYLGPPFSYQRTLGKEALAKHPDIFYGNESPRVDWRAIEALCDTFYVTKEDEVASPPVLYADQKFFETCAHEIFTKCKQIPQQKLGTPKYESFWKERGKKEIFSLFGKGIFIEEGGVVAIEAEYALENSPHAYVTPSSKEGLVWTHLQSETNNQTGLAMHVDADKKLWTHPEEAPGMHYKIQVEKGGNYHVWLLIRHYNKYSDSCFIALDGKVQPLEEQFSKGDLYTYNTSQVYYWCQVSDLEIPAGEHVFSILARKSRLRVDRIYLTQKEELPPIDAQWLESRRG